MSIAVISLYNIKTSQTVSGKVSEIAYTIWCNPIHLYPLIRRERFQHLGWCLKDRLDEVIEIEDRFQNNKKLRILDLVIEYGFTARNIAKLLKGAIVKGGIFLRGAYSNFKHNNPFSVSKYQIQTKNNKIVSGKTLIAISNQIHDEISYKSLCQLARGEVGKVKGYELLKIEEKRKNLICNNSAS